MAIGSRAAVMIETSGFGSEGGSGSYSWSFSASWRICSGVGRRNAVGIVPAAIHWNVCLRWATSA